MWFSQLSLGEMTRIAANQYMSKVHVCEEMSKIPPSDDGLPRGCPVAEGQRLPFQTQIGKELWKGVEEYRSTVVGASGELELRLYSGPPCDGWFDTDCEEPEVLLGLALPFVIVDGDESRGGEGDEEGEAKEGEESQATAEEAQAKGVKCEDAEPDCAGWARDGECEANAAFMRETCKKSCGGCSGGGAAAAECVDSNAADCPGWAKDGQCQANPEYMLQSCPESCGACQKQQNEL